jgi:hypothetical protein
MYGKARPNQTSSGTQDGQDYLVAGGHIELSLPIRDLGCGTSRRFFSPVPSEGPREVALVEGTSAWKIFRTRGPQPGLSR